MAAITCARAPQVNELARLLSRTAVEKLGSNVLKRVLFELPIAVDAQDGAAGATPCRAAAIPSSVSRDQSCELRDFARRARRDAVRVRGQRASAAGRAAQGALWARRQAGGLVRRTARLQFPSVQHIFF